MTRLEATQVKAHEDREHCHFGRMNKQALAIIELVEEVKRLRVTLQKITICSSRDQASADAAEELKASNERWK